MLGRGLSPEILARFDVGYDYRSDRITIPVRDLDGRLVGIKGRDWAGRHPAKYLPIGDSPSATARGDLRYGFGTYEISQVVFGLCYAREYKKAVVVEGEFNAMALAQLGVDRPIGTNTARMSPRQARLIVDECQEVIFLYDRGQAGHDGAHAGAELLSDHLVVRIAEPLDVDPCDALRDGRGAEVVRAIERAPSVLALTTVPW
jgi:DNA primase